MNDNRKPSGRVRHRGKKAIATHKKTVAAKAGKSHSGVIEKSPLGDWQITTNKSFIQSLIDGDIKFNENGQAIREKYYEWVGDTSPSNTHIVIRIKNNSDCRSKLQWLVDTLELGFSICDTSDRLFVSEEEVRDKGNRLVCSPACKNCAERKPCPHKKRQYGIVADESVQPKRYEKPAKPGSINYVVRESRIPGTEMKRFEYAKDLYIKLWPRNSYTSLPHLHDMLLGSLYVDEILISQEVLPGSGTPEHVIRRAQMKYNKEKGPRTKSSTIPKGNGLKSGSHIGSHK